MEKAYDKFMRLFTTIEKQEHTDDSLNTCQNSVLVRNDLFCWSQDAHDTFIEKERYRADDTFFPGNHFGADSILLWHLIVIDDNYY